MNCCCTIVCHAQREKIVEDVREANYYEHIYSHPNTHFYHVLMFLFVAKHISFQKMGAERNRGTYNTSSGKYMVRDGSCDVSTRCQSKLIKQMESAMMSRQTQDHRKVWTIDVAYEAKQYERGIKVEETKKSARDKWKRKSKREDEKWQGRFRVSRRKR